MRGEQLNQHEDTQIERSTAKEVGGAILSAADGEVNNQARDTKAERLETDLKSEVEYWSGEYNATEKQFAKYSRGMPADKEGREDYRETVAKYEEDIAYDWKQLDMAANKAMSGQLIRSSYELADTQRLGVVEPHETVEAATGIFYEERMQALRKRVEAAESSEETEAEQQLMRQTWRKVMDYVEASIDYDFLHLDYNAYQNARRACHNKMIRQLNALNQLAEKYDTTRFTPRNFMTNDFNYNAKYDKSRMLNHRADYDRETVLAYFQTVFKKDFELMDKKAQKSSAGWAPGMRHSE